MKYFGNIRNQYMSWTEQTTEHKLTTYTYTQRYRLRWNRQLNPNLTNPRYTSTEVHKYKQGMGAKQMQIAAQKELAANLTKTKKTKNSSNLRWFVVVRSSYADSHNTLN